MSYIEKSLAENEVLRYRARFHWVYHAGAWAALIAGAVVALLTLNGDASRWVPPASLLLGIAVWLAILVPIWTTEIGVTNQRIIYKRGLIQRDTNELQLRSIEEVRFSQDFWGRIFGYGKIEIHGTGDDAIFLPSVADPLGLRAALQGAVGDTHGDAAQPQPQHVNGAAQQQVEPGNEPIRAGQA
jgi:uncharacterized membrane protein YdbT with pleckstrin-like domain